MALDSISALSPVSPGLLSSLAAPARDFPLNQLTGRLFMSPDELDAADPVQAILSEPISLTRTSDAIRYPFTPDTRSIDDDARTPMDGMRLMYSQRGAPSDATPALTRLEARIAFEPVYLYQYATMRYDFVSQMPMTTAERRQQFNLLV